MAKKLYILKEELSQELYETKVKYLYTSELNRTIVNYVESFNRNYIYLSHNWGVLNPNDMIKPYKVTLLRERKKKVWSLLTAECIHRLCKESNINTIVLMFSGSFYSELEDRLKSLGYNIESPIRYFKTSKMKIKWLQKEVNDLVCKSIGTCNIE